MQKELAALVGEAPSSEYNHLRLQTSGAIVADTVAPVVGLVVSSSRTRNHFRSQTSAGIAANSPAVAVLAARLDVTLAVVEPEAVQRLVAVETQAPVVVLPAVNAS
jgi:hypothetical protein